MKGEDLGYKQQLSEAEAQLRAEITVYLNTCCDDKWNCLAKTIKEEQGREMVMRMAFSMCSTGEGMAIQSALSIIDSDLCSR